MIKIIYTFLILFLLTSCKQESLIPKVKPNVIIEETNKIITFEKDIKVILSNTCGPCHMANGDRINKWDTYSKTKTFITNIMERVNKQPNNDGFMPKNGKKLSFDELEKLQKWINDGLLEK